MPGRTHRRTHPWLRFRFDPGELPSDAWMNLGEVAAKLQWIGSSSMRPVVEEQLLLTFESKGIHATAALAGNTLDEQDVRRLVVDGLGPPRGEEYLWREVINLHDAHLVTVGLIGQGNLELTPESIRVHNSMVLHGPDHDDGSVRGEIRSGSVTVGNRRPFAGGLRVSATPAVRLAQRSRLRGGRRRSGFPSEAD